MKKSAVIIIFVLSGVAASAQQHALYSQYIFNLYTVNPAYAGSREALSANVGYRAQWVGFEGAPRTQNFSVHGPLRKKNMAAGLIIQNDAVGARGMTNVSATYGYALNLGRAQQLRFGLQGGVMNYRMDWHMLDYEQRNDPASWADDPNRWIPNFDFGAMYTSPRAYAGFSAMNLSRPALNNTDESDARLNTHFHIMAGKVFRVSENLSLKPGFLVRHTHGGPVNLDFTAGALIVNTLWITTGYRKGFGMVGAAHVYVSEKIHFGYSYDWTLNPMLSHQSGTHEIFLGYDFNVFKSREMTPRFF